MPVALALLAVALLAVAGAVVYARRRPKPPTVRDSWLHRRVNVALVDGSGFLGTLWRWDGTGVELIGWAGQPVQRIEADMSLHTADGRVFVPTDSVLFVQDHRD